jgi:hypothetical protein
MRGNLLTCPNLGLTTFPIHFKLIVTQHFQVAAQPMSTQRYCVLGYMHFENAKGVELRAHQVWQVH